MDRMTEQAVWQRVKGGGVPAGEALLPERLEALLLEQQAEAACLRTLARRLRGGEAAAVNRLAAETGAGAGELRTLHYLLTGRRLRLQTPKPGCGGPLQEELRAACLRARQSVRALEALAGEFSDYADDFSRLARQAGERGRVLAAALRRRLDA